MASLPFAAVIVRAHLFCNLSIGTALSLAILLGGFDHWGPFRYASEGPNPHILQVQYIETHNSHPAPLVRCAQEIQHHPLKQGSEDEGTQRWALLSDTVNRKPSDTTMTGELAQ